MLSADAERGPTLHDPGVVAHLLTLDLATGRPDPIEGTTVLVEAPPPDAPRVALVDTIGAEAPSPSSRCASPPSPDVRRDGRKHPRSARQCYRDAVPTTLRRVVRYLVRPCLCGHGMQA
ncbi:hypothetical protein [Acuticoccus mangrovi]|uniref:Uncharacterized protein n=1 Tax=Acuticoccus mangrovi TaxID=2796142 RepID=A0A934IL57_9HYPH|nr:hypothetical protein [Acuticoccus mangrovi]MBJ3774650.1 hypothetical protein [Acuticoccus mangrovi]